jgi:hypothetical protein
MSLVKLRVGYIKNIEVGVASDDYYQGVIYTRGDVNLVEYVDILVDSGDLEEGETIPQLIAKTAKNLYNELDDPNYRLTNIQQESSILCWSKIYEF